MRSSLALVLLLTLALPAGAAETHPFSIHDMLAMERISDPRVSPDGTQVAFVVRATDLEANRGRLDLYLAATDGSRVRRLTSHEAADSQPRWSADGRSLYFVSSRSGQAQVWRLSLEGGEAQPVTRLPLDVDALEVAPGGRHLVLSMAVFPGKSPGETKDALAAKEKSKASGLLHDRLFVRHWDTWKDGTRNHLFAYDIEKGQARRPDAGDGRGLPDEAVRRQRGLHRLARREGGRLLGPRRRARGGLVHELRPLLGPARRLHHAEEAHHEPRLGRPARVLPRRGAPRLPGDEPARLRGRPLPRRGARVGLGSRRGRSTCAPTTRRAGTARPAASAGPRTGASSCSPPTTWASTPSSPSTSRPARPGWW